MLSNKCTINTLERNPREKKRTVSDRNDNTNETQNARTHSSKAMINKVKKNEKNIQEGLDFIRSLFCLTAGRFFSR